MGMKLLDSVSGSTKRPLRVATTGIGYSSRFADSIESFTLLGQFAIGSVLRARSICRCSERKKFSVVQVIHDVTFCHGKNKIRE